MEKAVVNKFFRLILRFAVIGMEKVLANCFVPVLRYALFFGAHSTAPSSFDVFTTKSSSTDDESDLQEENDTDKKQASNDALQHDQSNNEVRGTTQLLQACNRNERQSSNVQTPQPQEDRDAVVAAQLQASFDAEYQSNENSLEVLKLQVRLDEHVASLLHVSCGADDHSNETAAMKTQRELDAKLAAQLQESYDASAENHVASVDQKMKEQTELDAKVAAQLQVSFGSNDHSNETEAMKIQQALDAKVAAQLQESYDAENHVSKVDQELKRQTDFDAKVAAQLQVSYDAEHHVSIEDQKLKTGHDAAVAAQLQASYDAADGQKLRDDWSPSVAGLTQDHFDAELEDYLRTSYDVDRAASNSVSQQVAETMQADFDQEMADQIQATYDEEEELSRAAKEDEKRKMESTATGKAWQLTEAVQKLVEENADPNISAVAVDDMVFLAEKMFEAQSNFAVSGLPTEVDLGYHYTRKTNISSIRTDGLMSRIERQENNIKSNFNGASYGEGIYTGNNADSFRHYGDTGLVVARLKGVSLDFTAANRGYQKGNNSITNGSMVVLEKSDQCLALVQYPSCVSTSALKGVVEKLQVVVDDFFSKSRSHAELDGQARSPAGTDNDRRQTDSLFASLFGHARSSGSKSSSTFPRRIEYRAPARLGKLDIDSVARDAPPSNNVGICPVCCGSLRYSGLHDRVVALHACGHELHARCLPQLLQESIGCPVCRTPVGNGPPQGTMPSGSMTVELSTGVTCQGFPDSQGTLVIRYMLPAGVQLSHHALPGHRFEATDRTAYLPHNAEGRRLLQRLEYAFRHGLTFRIGTSRTSGKSNVVTWAAIPHKTSLSGGEFGFPDTRYFAECHGVLDAHGVPNEPLE